MRIESLLDDCTEMAYIHLERKVNDVFFSDVKECYQPHGRFEHFFLPFLLKSESEIEVLNANPNASLLNGISQKKQFKFFIHPEMIDLYQKEGVNIEEQGKIPVSPTSSTRTVLTRYQNYNFMIKLDLAKKIGDNKRNIKRKHVEFSNKICKELESTKHLPFIAYLPETVGMLCKIGNNEIGLIFREFQPRPIINENRYLIPFFSLFSIDRDNPDEKLLLQQIIEKNCTSPKESLNFCIEQILRPYLDTWCYFAVKRGLIFELHPQNTLLEVDDNAIPRRIVFRDFQDFFIEPDLRIENGLDLNFDRNILGKSTKNYLINERIITDSNKCKKISCSLTYDYRVSRTLDLFSEALERYSICNPDKFAPIVKDILKKNLGQSDIFPEMAYFPIPNQSVDEEIRFKEIKPKYR